MVYKAKVERVCGKKRENGRKEGAEKREGREGEGMGIHPKRATLATAMVFSTGNSIEQKAIRFIY